MAILEVNENQKQMLLYHLEHIYLDLKKDGPYGSRSLELERIKDLEDVRDMMIQIRGAG